MDRRIAFSSIACVKLKTTIKFGLALLFATCILSLGVVAAQSPTWSAPEVMGDSWFPDIATDSTGAVHLVWASSDQDYDLVMYTSNTSGKGWSTPNDIQAMPAPVGRYATRPSLLIDPDGMLHLSYRGDTIWYTNVPLQQAADALAWSEPIKVVVAGYFSKLVYSSDRSLHLFFTENKVRIGCTNCFHLMHQRTTDGKTWSSAVDLTPALEGVAKPQIIVDAQNNIYVVFEAGYGGDLGQLSDPATVMFIASYDGGDTWTNPIRLSQERGDTPAAQARNVAIALDGAQNLIVVWAALPEEVVYYQISQNKGRTWSTPAPIPGILSGWSIYQSRLDDYTMAMDSAGHLHLILAGRHKEDETNFNLMHVEWDGSNWSQPDDIVTYRGDVPEWPRIAIGNGNQLHVTWFVRDQENLFTADTTNYKVFYACGQSAAPYIQPVAIAVPTPTPNFNIDISSQEVVTATAPSVLLDERLRQPAEQSVSIDTLKTENDDITTLAKSLVPATLVVGLITFFLYRRKRK